MSTFGDSRPFEYFCQNWVPSENQSFLNEGVTSGQPSLGGGGLVGQMTRVYEGTIFLGGCDTLKGVLWAVKKKLHFSAHLQQLKGHLALTYFIKNQLIGASYGVLSVLFHIFEYVTNWPFAGPLSADF